MGPYLLLVLVLVGLSTLVFCSLGFSLLRAFIIATVLVIATAIIGTSWTLIAVRLVQF